MKDKGSSSNITRRTALKVGGTVVGAVAFGTVGAIEKPSGNNHKLKNNPTFESTKVDFSYAFGAPHRITAGRPDASDRTLLDVKPGSLKMSWTYDNLSMANYAPLAFRTPPTLWNFQIVPEIDGMPFVQSHWKRFDEVLPGLDNIYNDEKGSVRLEVLSGMTAAPILITVTNNDSIFHQYTIKCDSGSWGENPAWIDPKWNRGDHVLAGWNERADRVLILGLGADSYSLQSDGTPPGPKKMILVWNLKPGETRQGWIIRPYQGYSADLPALRKQDWKKEMEQGKAEWHKLLKRASKISVPDQRVSSAYLACLADLFIMREPIADGNIIGVPGTEGYRAGNSGEPLIVAVALDQNGLHMESVQESAVSIGMQEPDGCWADRQGWCHTFWAAAGFKAWAVTEHYRLTKDKVWLSKVYPHMLASSRWQETQRSRMRLNENRQSATYGLMPRGFGDCGLMNDDDNYGVFFPHNIWLDI